MKKSLLEAINEAFELSLKNPNIKYTIFANPRGEIKVHSASFLNFPYLKDRVYFEGYAPVCSYINGEKEEV